MSHRLHANLPVTQSQLQPTVPDFSLLKAKEVEKKKNQKRVFGSRHAVHDLHLLFQEMKCGYLIIILQDMLLNQLYPDYIMYPFLLRYLDAIVHTYDICQPLTCSRGIATQNAEPPN